MATEGRGDVAERRAVRTTTTIDANHPLYLQPCDTPSSSLISFQLTGPENYALWSRSMKIALVRKSKMGIVDGRHAKDTFEVSLHDLWEKVNAIVLSWIMSSVSSDLVSCVAYASNTCTVWSDLEERFDKENGSRIFQLHKEITTLTQGTSSISSYFTKLKDLWVEYNSLVPCPGCECAGSRRYVEHYQYQRFLQFLTGLNETYSQARSQNLMMMPVPRINKAYSMLISEESQRILGKTIEDSGSVALFSNRTSFNQDSIGGYPLARGNHSGISGNLDRGSYKGRNAHLFCEYCKWRGHTKETCYKIYGYPNDHKFKKKSAFSPQYKANAVCNATGNESFQGRAPSQAESPQPGCNPNQGSGVMEQYDQILKILKKEIPTSSENTGSV